MRLELKFNSLRKSDGSVLLWTLGCFFISLMVIMTAISVAGASQAQGGLENLTDAGALAPANELATESALPVFFKSEN